MGKNKQTKTQNQTKWCKTHPADWCPASLRATAAPFWSVWVNIGVLSTLFSFQVQNTAPCQILWEKLTLCQPKPGHLPYCCIWSSTVTFSGHAMCCILAAFALPCSACKELWVVLEKTLIVVTERSAATPNALFSSEQCSNFCMACKIPSSATWL